MPTGMTEYGLNLHELSSVVSPPLREQIQKTMDWMQKQPRNEKYLGILAALAEAWLSRSQIKYPTGL